VSQEMTHTKSGYAVPELANGQFSRTRIAILATRWNTDIVDSLVEGARRCLTAWGVPASSIGEYRAPGAYELPLAAAKLLESGLYDGVVALGAVIRGDTPHFDFVAGECSRGLMDVQLRFGSPIGFGVLTVNTVEQAVERASSDDTNKGYEAAAAVLDLLMMMRSIA